MPVLMPEMPETEVTKQELPKQRKQRKVTKARRVSTLIDHNSSFQTLFVPSEIKQQIIRLSQILGIKSFVPDLRGLKTSLPVPDDDYTGFCVTLDYDYFYPDYSQFSSDYSKTLQELLQRIYESGIRIQNELQGRIINNFMVDPNIKRYLDACPSFGPFKLFPINTGHKWTRFSASEVRQQLREKVAQDEGEWIEFPIRSLDCFCLYAAHSSNHDSRMIQRGGILPICAGDSVGSSTMESKHFPMIDFDGEGRKFKTIYGKKKCDIRQEFGHHSVWTGFVQRKSFVRRSRVKGFVPAA